MGKTQLDIVIPVFNEIEIIEQLHSRVTSACQQIGVSYRIIYVDDGSKDETANWLTTNAVNQSSSDPNSIAIASALGNVTLIELSRNFGQPAAILAGLKHSTADCTVIMDGDLQDPPELIPEMYQRWQAGDQVVIAQRTGRKETFLRGLAFKTFHKFFALLSDSSIPANAGTFCLLDRIAAESICQLPESHRFFPGLRAWVGFRQSMVKFKRPPRAGGEPKQTFIRLFSYALDAVFGYSYKPLRLLTGIGCVVCVLSFLLASWFVFKRVVGWETASLGFTTLSCAILGLCGFQLIGMGILGEYIGRIYDEVKRRPQYLVGQQTHSDQAAGSQRPGQQAQIAQASSPPQRRVG